MCGAYGENCMKSKDVAFQIGQLLFYTHEDKPMNEKEIEDAIREIAGEDNRTLTKYKNLLIKYQHIKHLESGRYQIG